MFFSLPLDDQKLLSEVGFDMISEKLDELQNKIVDLLDSSDFDSVSEQIKIINKQLDVISEAKGDKDQINRLQKKYNSCRKLLDSLITHNKSNESLAEKSLDRINGYFDMHTAATGKENYYWGISLGLSVPLYKGLYILPKAETLINMFHSYDCETARNGEFYQEGTCNEVSLGGGFDVGYKFIVDKNFSLTPSISNIWSRYSNKAKQQAFTTLGGKISAHFYSPLSGGLSDVCFLGIFIGGGTMHYFSDDIWDSYFLTGFDIGF